VLDAMAQIVSTCREANVVVGHPHVETHNVERVVKEGYRFLMCAPVRSYGNLDKARELTGRA
jgi:4-hydroxy-2-oxoheptanedioate aldolase